jgi:hypothetical protein
VCGGRTVAARHETGQIRSYNAWFIWPGCLAPGWGCTWSTVAMIGRGLVTTSICIIPRRPGSRAHILAATSDERSVQGAAHAFLPRGAQVGRRSEKATDALQQCRFD